MAQIVGSRVRGLREGLRLTQDDLTRLVQELTGGMLRRPNLSKIENDRYGEPGVWVVVALAKALRTSPEYLLGLTENPAPTGDADAIFKNLGQEELQIVRRLAELVDAMSVEQKAALLSFTEAFLASSVRSPRIIGDE
jgi:transcriptional regulator with XRE-family HTH domain